MRTKIGLYFVFLSFFSAVLAEYPSGYFYAIFRGDTFCIRPVITDSVTEAEWFDYTSSSIHTGLETAYETHFFFFYNPFTGRIGFVTQHNIDEGGTDDAWCEMYLDGIPPACSVLVSDDPGHSHSHSTGRPCGSAQEFDLDCYPQGGWEWYNNTDGGAMTIPRSEWRFTIRVTFGGTDPIHTMWFLSGDDGSDRIYLDTVITGQEDTIIVGHGFLELLTFADSIWFDSTNIYTADTFHFPVCNSDETADTLYITGVTLSHSENYTILHYPTVLAPGECDDIVVEFHPDDTGFVYDTLVINKLIPCDSVTYVPIIGRGIRPRIDSVWFWEETDCDGQNVVEVCYNLYGEAGVPNSVQAFFTHESLGEEWFNFAEFTVEDTAGDFGDSVYPGVHCFNWDLSEDFPRVEVNDLEVKVGIETISDTFFIEDSINLSDHEYGHGLAYGDTYYWIYNSHTGYIYQKNSIYPDSSAIDSFFIGTGHNMDIDYDNGFIYFAVSGGAPFYLCRLDTSAAVIETLAVLPDHHASDGANIQGIEVENTNVYLAYYDPDSMYIFRLNLEDYPPEITGWDTIAAGPMDENHAMEGLALAFGKLFGCNNYGKMIEVDLVTGETEVHPVPNSGSGAEGLCWDGEYIWYHNSVIGKLYKVKITGVSNVFATATGPVDSRPPAITLSCPPDTVFFNDSVLITYEKDDLFPNSTEPESVIIYYCDGADTIIGEDSIIWVPPLVNCDSAFVSIAAPDSFCNWGYDTCQFTIMATGSLVIIVPETTALPCDTIDIPILCGDRFYPIMSQLELWIQFNPAIGTPAEFSPTVSPTPDSFYIETDENICHIINLWDTRTLIEGDTLGYISFVISCGAAGGDILPLFIDSTYTDIINIYTVNGYVVIDYTPEQWLTNLWFEDTARDVSEYLTFGNSYGARDDYDPETDILYVSPPPSGIDVWFNPQEEFTIYRLKRDIKDMTPQNIWYVIINYDVPLYVHWDKNTFDEGLYLLNGVQDMRADTDYYAEPYETLTITWDLPELHPQMLHLYPGWNLISLPVYNPAGGASSIIPGVLAGPYGYNSFTNSFYYAENLEPGHGYWIFAGEEMEIPVLGVSVHGYRIDASHGWNLVGATADTVPLDSVGVSYGSVLSLFEYAPDLRSYVPADNFEPGKGYWIYISGGGVLFVPAH